MKSPVVRSMIIVAFAAFLLMAHAGVSSAATVWTVQDVDAPRSISGDTTNRGLALEGSTGYPHLVYGSDELYHAYYDGQDWRFETVDDTVAIVGFASVAIDSNNMVHICYLDYASHDLKYATNKTGFWEITVIDTGSEKAKLALDTAGNVHIAYSRQSSGPLYYATNSSGSWALTSLDSAVSWKEVGGIATDGSGFVHITYYDGADDDLKLATNASGAWVVTALDSAGDVGLGSSIAVDSAGKLHICYTDTTNGYLKYATDASGDWVFTPLVNGGSWGSIAVDSNADVHIAFLYVDDQDMGNNGVRYGTNSSGSWEYTALELTGPWIPGYLSVAVDADNVVCVSHVLQGVLRYSTDASGGWVTTTLDASMQLFGAISAAVDGADNLHLSYYDYTNKDLRYATNSPGYWTISTLDDAGDVGKGSSIAVDGSGHVHISYFDETNRDLKYATNSSGAWVCTTLESQGSVGAETSIAVDAGGYVHISYCEEYYDTPLGGYYPLSLKYATNASGSWVFQTVDTGGKEGYACSIAIDANGKAHISYYRMLAGALKYATNAYGGWSITTLDADQLGGMGTNTSIALDGNNYVYISYYAKQAGVLRYATNASGVWATSTLDGAATTGAFSSIALDNTNKIHISYYDVSNHDLKYATNKSGAWVMSTLDSYGWVGAYTSIVLGRGDNLHIGYLDLTKYDVKYAKGTDYNNFGASELQHYDWSPVLTGGDCGKCHIPQGSFLSAGFRTAPEFCYSCHNSAGLAHDRDLDPDRGHSLFGFPNAAGRKHPTYGNVTSGERNNTPHSRLVSGGQMACITCHNVMAKTEDYGRVWEPTTTADHLTYTLMNGGWKYAGGLAPEVYRDRSLWAGIGPSNSYRKKEYLVGPSEYAYDPQAGTVTFSSPQDQLDYIYVSIDYPYLRASQEDNRLCGDCHANITHQAANCLDCHTAHNSGNLGGVRETVVTPDGSAREVRFLGYSGPSSFADGDAVHDGICEVCHTATSYYRADGSGFANHSGGSNYDGKACTACHRHSRGFAR